MTGGVSVLAVGEDGGRLADVRRALGALSVDIAETVEAATVARFDCVVVTALDRVQGILDAIGDARIPVVVVTDDAGRPDDDRVRHHPADSLAALGGRVRDAALAERERRRAESGDEGGLTYRTLVDSIPNGGVALFDRDLRYTLVGGEVFELVDLEPADVEGKRLAEAHSSAFVEAYGDAYRGAFDGERTTFEFSYDDRIFRSEVRPVHENGSVVAGMVMTREVTAEVERQRDLLVKTRAMDAAAIGLCLTDPTQPDNPLVYVNEGYERITGYDAAEVLGRNPRHLQGPETEPEPSARMREAVANAEACSVDITNYRKDGTPFVNHVEITPIFDEDGTLVHFLGSQIDVTDQHERERSLARQNERLEEFTSIVSHDLRSPLAVVRGSIELARTTGDLSNLERAERGLGRMTALIEDLLTLAREGQALDPERVEPVSVGTVARDAWHTVDTGDARLAVGDDLSVEADESRLRQLFENLFRNAVEHGTGPRSDAPVDDGEDRVVEIRVGTLPDDRGFYVADDGPGVPASVRDRVFEAGVTTVETGTGFGLAIVRTVAEAHDWDAAVTESDDGGARFEFRVRRVDPGADEDGSPDGHRVGHRENGHAGS